MDWKLLVCETVRLAKNGGNDLEERESNEKKKEYLRSYQKAVRREQEILEEIQQLRMDKMFPSVVNDGMPKGSKQSDLSEYVVKLDNLIEKLKQEKFEKIKLMDDILYSISLLEDEDEKSVLRMRYIKGVQWEDICVVIKYSWRQTHRIHSNALKNLQIPKTWHSVAH